MGNSVEKTSARQGLSLFVIFHKEDILSHTTIFSSVKHNPHSYGFVITGFCRA